MQRSTSLNWTRDIELIFLRRYDSLHICFDFAFSRFNPHVMSFALLRVFVLIQNQPYRFAFVRLSSLTAGSDGSSGVAYSACESCNCRFYIYLASQARFIVYTI